ncbi:with sequence similarity 65, member A [Chamberlinius hualienensis]
MNEQGKNFGISRSKSFAGILSHVRTSSNGSNATNGSSSSCSGHQRPDSLGRSSVLGQNHRKSSGSLRNLGVALAKIPKNPRPIRTLAIFEAISNGLSECVNVTEDDISSLKGSLEILSINSQQSQGKLYELEKQLKAAERYLKRLEYQLASLEELQEQYSLQQKLRDGVCTMARAFVLSPGREKESALSNVRSGYKECVETLCWVEGQLEYMMGTLQMEMKGVQGFARLCSGDAFEITIRHGHQKWKSRGRILKNKQQTWDSKGYVFKALLGEVLHIKAMEIKGLGKTVVLGNKYCETKELFCANPQIMTVNLNSSGSLKLSIVITWNPLDTKVDDQPSPFRPHATLPKATTDPFLSRPRIFSPPHSLSHGSLSSQLTLNTAKDNGSDSCSIGSGSGRSSAKDYVVNRRPISLQFPLTAPVPPPRLHLKSTSLDSLNLNSSQLQQQQKRIQQQQHQILLKQTMTGNLHKADSSDCCSMDLGSSSQGSHCEGPTLQDVVLALSSCLEDIQGQYPELHRLQMIVSELEQGNGAGVRSRRGSSSSEMSLSVEMALECFDFLNTEVGEDDNEFTEDKLNLDPDLTAKTSDSGIASIAVKLRGLNSNSPESLLSSNLVTASEQLELALCTHLQACQRLLINVGSFGPLKCREKRSLDHLKSQTTILERLLKLSAICKDNKSSTITGRDELKEDPQLQQLWDFCCAEKALFCISSEQCYHRLSMTCQQYLPWGKQTSSTNNNVSEKVARLIVSRIWDTGRFDPEAIITVHQFSDYFWRTCRSSSLDGLFRELSEEVTLMSLLQSGNASLLLQTVSWQSNCLPSDECLWMMATLLSHNSKPLQHTTCEYFIETYKNTSLREKLLRILSEGLEADVATYRQGACVAISSIKAAEFTSQLAYLCQTDENPSVKQSAKSALLSIGPEGRRAYEQTQLTSLGFQGLAIH